MKEFDKLFESILSEISRGNVPRIDHDDKATMYGAPVDKLVKNTKELDAKYGKPKPKKELKLERKYPAKAPKGDSFIKSTGVPSRVDSRKSTTDQYVRTHKNPTTTHGKKFGTRKESTIHEDGHQDVESVNNQIHTAIKALKTIKDQVNNLSPETDLPTWWTNKVAIAIDKLDNMADYLDAQVPESVDQLDEKQKPAKQQKKKKNPRDKRYDPVSGKYYTPRKMPSESTEQLEEKSDRCKRRADSVYGKKTSAYKSGAIVRCRKGKIWKKK